MEEIWKDVIGYEGLYMISNKGNVKTLSRVGLNSRGRAIGKKERILRPNSYKNSGYRYVTLFKSKVGKSLKIHRLIAIHFIPNPESKETVNHINGIKTDNSIENLEWATQRENLVHALRTGLRKGSKGVKNGMTKLTEKEVLEIRNIKGLSQYKIADLYGVGQGTINRVLQRICWKHI